MCGWCFRKVYNWSDLFHPAQLVFVLEMEGFPGQGKRAELGSYPRVLGACFVPGMICAEFSLPG